ncbi:hypothetical protein ACLOJK_010038, partial [Asimina triloba]
SSEGNREYISALMDKTMKVFEIELQKGQYDYNIISDFMHTVEGDINILEDEIIRKMTGLHDVVDDFFRDEIIKNMAEMLLKAVEFKKGMSERMRQLQDDIIDNFKKLREETAERRMLMPRPNVKENLEIFKDTMVVVEKMASEAITLIKEPRMLRWLPKSPIPGHQLLVEFGSINDFEKQELTYLAEGKTYKVLDASGSSGESSSDVSKSQ